MPDPTLTTPTIEPPVGDPQPAGGDWKAVLSEETRNHPTIQNLADIPAMAKMLLSAEGMVGADKVVIPGRDASDETVNEFYTKLGRPDKPEDYKLPTEGLPEGVDVNEDVVKGYFAAAHKMGMSSQHVAGMYRWLMTQIGESDKSTQQAMGQQLATDVASLRSEWGDAYDERVALAQRAVAEFGGEELKKHLNDTGQGNDPAVIRAWAKVGQAVGSDEILGGGAGTTFGLAPAEAQAKINEKQLDAKFMHAVTSEYDQGHKAAVEEMNKLYAAAFPDKQKSQF